MKDLILYYSRADENYYPDGIKSVEKGNTAVVAETLASLTGADLHHVEPAVPYPAGYRECCDQAQAELMQGARPAVKNPLADINNYSTIYILIPVWWGQVPPAMMTQLEGLNWAGKTVHLITTHEGSGLGETARDLATLGITPAKTLSIPGHEAPTCAPTLQSWLK